MTDNRTDSNNTPIPKAEPAPATHAAAMPSVPTTPPTPAPHTSATVPVPPVTRATPQWREALAAAEAIPALMRPTDAQLATLSRACAEPRHLRLLLDAFARHAASLPASAPSAQYPYAFFCDFVDDSAHDLREWINALAVFDDWLRANNRPPQPLSMLLAYLSCSAEAQANSPLPLPLPHILADMLELYGYESTS